MMRVLVIGAVPETKGTKMAGRLQGKVALVFGAGSSGSGMSNGRAVSIAYAREGARVIAVDVNAESAAATASAVEAEGGCCESLSADVRVANDVGCLVARVADRYGRVDILHNNVGMAFVGGPVELPESVWRNSMELNVGSIFLTCKHVLPIMERQSSGAIVNVSSIASIRWLGYSYVAYSASKAAVNQFTQSVAVQYASKGIRANAVLPGLMDTPIARNALLGSEYQDEAELVAKRSAACPMQRMGDAWDVANASVFLASDEAKYITGVCLPVDGGLTCKCA
jgi:NAD(P)-dependent dehydrogenase (short-subunit alcohol dehydrogenase family)